MCYYVFHDILLSVTLPVLQVQQISVLLADWEEQMTQLHIQYEQLLFFSIPKLLHLYELMMSKEIDDVAKEVGFLFQNKPDVQQKLRETVEVMDVYVIVL